MLQLRTELPASLQPDHTEAIGSAVMLEQTESKLWECLETAVEKRSSKHCDTNGIDSESAAQWLSSPSALPSSLQSSTAGRLRLAH